LAGFAAGVGLTMFFILQDGIPDTAGPKADPTAQPAADGDKPLVELAAGDSARKPKYDFYSVLPEMEVVIPDAELKEQNQKPAPAPPAAGERLVLQVSSHTNAADAEAIKARLALTGVQANVVPVTIDGRTWHRVRLGPFADSRALEAAKRELEAQNFEPIALREAAR
jgi:cell division protein FtsN